MARGDSWQISPMILSLADPLLCFSVSPYEWFAAISINAVRPIGK